MMLAEVAAKLWDVVIIGAGPAGSTLALELARQGFEVLLVDRASFPRGKVCGGCLNGNALAALARIGLAHLPAQLGGQTIQKLWLGTNGRSATIALDEGIGVSRQSFDAALVDAAARAGATFLPGVRASMEDGDGNSRTVSIRNSTECVTAQARIAILAHGLKAGTIAPHSRIGAGVVLEESPGDFPQHTISMAVGEGGYVGGVHVEDGRYDLAAAFDASFVQACGSLGLAAEAVLRQAGFPPIPGLDRAPWKGTPLLTRRPQSIAGPRWFAVGDAAGYVEPFTGEGMAWAMNGALALAPIVAAAIADGKESHAGLWTRTHARQVGRRQLQCRVLANVLRSPKLTAVLVRCLAVCPALAKPFVRNLSRPTTRLRGVAS